MAYQERGAGDEEAKERPSGAVIEAGPAADGAASTASLTKPAAPSSAASPTTSWRHVGLLWAACGLTVGAYYSKDVLAAVSPDLIKDFHMSREQYGALYGLPAIPNIFASLIGGALVDFMGSDHSALLLALVVVLGSLLTSLSAPLALSALLAAGQLTMGVGKGSLITAQKVFIKGAAHPEEVSLYFALSFSTSHGGTFLAFLLSPLVTAAAPIGYEAALWTSTGVCMASALCALPLLGKRPAHGRAVHQPDQEQQCEEDEGEQEPEAGGGSWRRRLWLYWRGLASTGFLLSLVSIVCYYAAFFPFMAFSVHFLVSARGMPHKSASLYASLLPLGSVFLGPYFGHRVDVELGKPDRGWHGWWRRGGGQPQGNGSNSSGSRWSCVAQWLALPGSVQLWGMLVTVLGLALVAAAPGAWVVGFVAMGLGFAMGSSSLWAMVPVFVQCKSLGLAFGVVHALMDIVLLVVSVAVGAFLDAGESYAGSVLPLLLGIALVALLASVLQMRLLCALRRRAAAEADGDGARQHEGPSAQYPALLSVPRSATREISGNSRDGDVESG